jgi:signal transduction histidine kinase
MLRSPIFYLIVLLFLFSCKKDNNSPTNTSSIKKEAFKTRDQAIISFQDKKFNSSFYNFNKSKISFEIVKDSANIVYNLIQMASIQQINGDYYGSKETLTEALPYIKKKNIYSAAINNLFGIAFKELSIYNDAIYYYKEALKDCEDSISKLAPLNNIAVVYIQQKKYDQAIKILEDILKGKVFYKEPIRTVSILDNLGYAYFKKGQPEKGLSLMNEGLAIRNQTNDSYGGIESNLHLAEYYAKSNSQKSNLYAQTAYQVATKSNSIDERLKALSFLILNKNSINTSHYAQKYISLNDSIIKIRNNFKNKFAKIKYDSKKEKDENQQLRLEKSEDLLSLQKAKYQKIVLAISIFSLVIIILILIRYYRNKNRVEKIKASYDTETRISKKIHDELANDVFHAITFTQTQPLTQESTKESLLEKLDQIYKRVRGISRENNDIDTSENFAQNVKEMLSLYNTDGTNVIVNNLDKISWDGIDEIKKITIYRILQELMVNMRKHSEASLVVVKFDQNQKNIFIDYVDNGIGCAKNKIIKNGLQNMENRILAIKGTITFDTEPNKGFKVKMSLPK